MARDRSGLVSRRSPVGRTLMRSRTWCIVAAVGAPILACGTFYLLDLWLDPLGVNALYKGARDKFSVGVGLDKADFIRKFGQPDQEFQRSPGRRRPPGYPVEGYSYPTRPITNEVLVYILDEPIVYVFIGSDDRVEEVWVGGS